MIHEALNMKDSLAYQSLPPAKRWALTTHWQGDLLWDVDMAPYCTLRAGGRADALVHVASLGELARLLPWLTDNGIAWRVLGRGSNVLVSAQGFHGVIIRLSDNFSRVRRSSESTESGSAPVIVQAGAGCSLARLIAWATSQALSGLEFLVGIPGTVGGAVRMNAGAFGREIGHCLQCVSIMDASGVLHELRTEDLRPAYRSMGFRDQDLEDGVIVGASFALQRSIAKEIAERNKHYLLLRREKQPGGVASAGSFFKNPAGDSAGRLIDAAGLKGLTRGDAMISHKHANFLVNVGNASAADITWLMREVQERVLQHAGVLLEPEVHFL